MIPLRDEHLDPKDIILPKDYVPDPKTLAQMVTSLRTEGLFHPPIVKDNMEIVTGRMRVAAARGNYDSIACKVCPSNLTENEYRVLSLHENLNRHNIPWDEQVILEREFHLLRQGENGAGTRGKKTGWSMRDTAEELDMALGVVSEDIRIAEAILADPNLRKIKDKGTAKKVIFESLKRSSQELGAGRPVSIDVNKCHCGESQVILRAYPDCTFDACITDPPWIEFKDASLTKDAFTLDVFREVYRVLKANAFMYAFVSTQDWQVYYEDLQKIGFSVQKWPLIWVKEGVLTHGRRTWEYQRDYEPIILAVKGSPAITESMISSVMVCKVVHSSKLVHPNEKPPEVIKRIVDNCSYEGALILDPFAGSFVVPDVCKQMRRRYVAIEKDTSYFVKGQERLNK